MHGTTTGPVLLTYAIQTADTIGTEYTDLLQNKTLSEPEPAPTKTKAQKRQEHLDQQKKLWDGAENPGRNLWLESQGVVPLKQEFKPQVQLLSRKPAAVIARKDATNGIANLKLDDDEDSEEENRKKQQADLEERQRKAKIEREEKARKYAEARERIMGSSNPTSPAPPASRESSHGRDNRRSRQKVNGKRESQPTSSADQSPARIAMANGDKSLFDPDDMGRRAMPKREQASTPREDHPSRQPKGPEGGRGGFGFAGRGGRPTS